MDVASPLHEYIRRVITSVRSHKVLYLDGETQGIVAQLLSQTDALESDVFLIHRLGTEFKSDANIGHLTAIVFVRPTDENIDQLVAHLRNPKHAQYCIFFSNTLQEHHLQRLAQADAHEVVRQVQELFADIYPINRDLWSLQVGDQCAFYKEQAQWTAQIESAWSRQVDGLAAFLLSVKKKPIIRYEKSSALATKMAKDIEQCMARDSELWGWSQPQDPMLLVLDRRSDPITPLLMQWTYQAMVHEVLTINNSRVRLKQDQGQAQAQAESKGDDHDSKELNEVVLNPFNDSFFAENVLANYGEIASKTQKLVMQFAAKKQQNRGLESIEDMQRFVESYPDFLAEQGSVSKHLGIVSELRDAVNHRKLLDVSAFEQAMVCESSQFKQHMQDLERHVKNPNIDSFDKLRLCILFCLRYEAKLKSTTKSRIRALLTDNCRDDASFDSRDVELLNLFLRRYGKEQRGRASALFSEEKSQQSSIVGRFNSFVKSQVQDVQCVFTQHNPLLHDLIDYVIQGKLDFMQYPSTTGAGQRLNRPRDLIIFIVGGATYEEGLTVSQKNKQNSGINIVLGSGFMHNSRTFLEDIKKHEVSYLD